MRVLGPQMSPLGSIHTKAAARAPSTIPPSVGWPRKKATIEYAHQAVRNQSTAATLRLIMGRSIVRRDPAGNRSFVLVLC